MKRSLNVILLLLSLVTTASSTINAVRDDKPVDTAAWAQALAPLLAAHRRGRPAWRLPPRRARR